MLPQPTGYGALRAITVLGVLLAMHRRCFTDAAGAAAFQRSFRAASAIAGRSRAAGRCNLRNGAAPPPVDPTITNRFALSSMCSSAASAEPSTEQRSSSSSSVKSPRRPWYSDPSLGRDKSRVVNAARSSGGEGQVAAKSDRARFALFLGREAYHIAVAAEEDGGGGGGASEPLFLTYDELIEALGEDLVEGAISEEVSSGTTLAWVGERDGLDYWALRLPVRRDGNADDIDAVSNRLTQIIQRQRSGSSPSAVSVSRCPLREVGDGLDSASDAAVLATANGLLEFHSSHSHCSRCGTTTAPANAGRSRRCTNKDCRVGVYPRIDAASIMLVTSPCGEYALLGRKSNWPKGRYSTLAGFAEVGETLEECCVRETLEESGVGVDPASVVFVASQPWPFPRSLMVGFRARAERSGVDGSGSAGNGAELPEIKFCEDEMEDVRWFHRDYVASKLKVCEGSTALTYQPTEEEAEFHVPGKASLARLLILEWVAEQ